MSLVAADGPAMSYENTFTGTPEASTGPIHVTPSYEYAVENTIPRPTATHIRPFHATSRASTENTDFPVIPVHVIPPSSENASEFVRPFPPATHFSPFHATVFAPRDPPTPNDVPAAISAADENIALVAPPGTIAQVAPSSSEYEIVPVVAGAGEALDLARISLAPPPPPPTAIIRFAGKVTLLSSRPTLMGAVNAFVVIPTAPNACVVNDPALRWTPIHVAGTGGVAVE
jgi:hypothetical protein